MMPTPNRASSATAARTTTRALDPTEAKRLARIIQRLHTATDREAAALWGSDYRGLACRLFSLNGSTPLTASVMLMLDAEGRVVGFSLDGDTVDYNDLVASTETAASPILAQPANQNLGRACSTPAIEERLVRHLNKTPLPDPIIEALADLGIELEHLPLTVANKIARAIISEALRNAISPEQAGALHMLRAFGATVRQALIRPLFKSDGRAQLRRDLLLQAPILGLVPSALYAFAGRSPKDALRSHGLPVEARHILPKALSPVARWMHLDERELSADDLGWLTPALCNALPETTPGQHAVMSLALELLLGHLDDAAVAERCIWACQHAGELFAKDTISVRGWLLADTTLLIRAGIAPWCQAISAKAALAAAAATAEIHTILKDAERSSAFPLPNWANRQRLPNSKWVFTPIQDEIGLIASGARMRNCAGIYGPAARTGGTIIAEIRRTLSDAERAAMVARRKELYEIQHPETKNGATKDRKVLRQIGEVSKADRFTAEAAKATGKVMLPRDGDEEIGALVEISHRWDRWQLVQATGFANSEPRASAVDAVARFLTQINGEG